MLRRAPVALLLAALAVAAAGCGGSYSSSSSGRGSGSTAAAASTGAELDGEVGPGFTIEVKQGGKDAEQVAAGKHTLKVRDRSDQHDFHLIGPGVDTVVTGVGFQGEKTVTVTVEQGTYTYQCDPHASNGMRGTFTVTAGGRAY